MRCSRLLIFIGTCFMAGCAAPKVNLPEDSFFAEDLQKQVMVISAKFEAAKKENLNLKRELTIFKKSQNIDTRRLIEATDIFEAEFKKEINDQDVNVMIRDRGLVLIVTAEKLFISGAYDLSDEGKALLDRVVKISQVRFPTNYIYIEGHTDNQSLAVFEWKSDWDFSFQRALSVVRYLTQKEGFNPLRLSASGFGQYRPRMTNDTKEGRRLNRRIEIVISSQKIRQAQ